MYAAVRLRPDDLCEDPSSTEVFASLVAGFRDGAAKKRPKRLSCGHRDGSLVIVCGLCWRVIAFD